MAKQTDRREDRKSAHVGRKAAGTAAILALLAGGGYFGLGIGNPDGGFINPSSPATQPTEITQEVQTTTATEATTTVDANVLAIIVKESGISYQGKDVSITELEQALLQDYQEGKKLTLTDDHAIKSVYDEVTALLNKLKLPFEGTTP